MILPVAILVGQCLVVGIFPTLTVAPFLALAATAVLNGPLPAYDLAVWHGFNAPFMMSLIAMLGGILLYSLRHRLFALHDRLFWGIEAHLLYQRVVDGLIGGARIATEAIDNGSLQRSVALLLLAAGLAVLLPMATGESVLAGELPLPAVDPVTLFGAVLAMIAAAVLTVLFHRQRFPRPDSPERGGAAGALTFVRFSAPDLALTQLAVEVVTIILLLLALFFLPQRTGRNPRRWRRGRDLLLAICVGCGCGLVTWAILTRPYTTIADYFMANSLPGGGGANVVNVILVDFRGFDTLGEISVLAIAAIGIHALLDRLCLRPGTLPGGCRRALGGRAVPPGPDPDHPLSPAAGPAGLDLPVPPRPQRPGRRLHRRAGHRRGPDPPVPGQRHRLDQGTVGGALPPADRLGVLLALLTGLGSWLFNRPFLTSAFGHFPLPLVGEFELATAMLFDLGVYLTVVGVLMLVLTTLGDLSRRCVQTGRGT